MSHVTLDSPESYLLDFPSLETGRPVYIAYFNLEGQLQHGEKAEINCSLQPFLHQLSYTRVKTPLNSNREHILKCQRQLQSDYRKVAGLKILVRLGKQEERSCPPAVQIEIDSSKRSQLKPAIPLLSPTGSWAGLSQFSCCTLLHCLSSQGSEVC